MIKVALIGVGFVAPRHLQAMKATGMDLIAVHDPHDNVGVLDSYFPEAKYFPEWSAFDRYVTKEGVDYVSICTPNYLHEGQARWAMRAGADAIIEKPVALTEENVYYLMDIEQETGRECHCILQLRYNEDVMRLKMEGCRHQDVQINYSTPRGSWYDYSWKGDVAKSGGLMFNIGVHLVDLTTYLFGKLVEVQYVQMGKRAIAGNYHLDDCHVSFTLNTNIPMKLRSMTVGETVIDLDKDFNSLHEVSYQEIIAGNGWGLRDAKEGIKVCQTITRKGFQTR